MKVEEGSPIPYARLRLRSPWRSCVHYWKTQPRVVEKLCTQHAVWICRHVHGRWDRCLRPWPEWQWKQLQCGGVHVAGPGVGAGLRGRPLCCLKKEALGPRRKCLPATAALRFFYGFVDKAPHCVSWWRRNVYRVQLWFHKAGERRVDLELRQEVDNWHRLWPLNSIFKNLRKSSRVHK